MDIQWIALAQAAFARVYGARRAPKVCAAVMPGVMGDFRKTVLAAPEGMTVREEYRTDDRRTEIRLAGRRETRAGRAACVVTHMEIGGVAIALGAAGELVL